MVLNPIEVTEVSVTCNGDNQNGFTADYEIMVTGGYPEYVTISSLDPLADNMFDVAETQGNGTLSTAITGDATTIILSDVAAGNLGSNIY